MTELQVQKAMNEALAGGSREKAYMLFLQLNEIRLKKGLAVFTMPNLQARFEKPIGTTGKKIERYRDVELGLFVTLDYARRHPETSVKETVSAAAKFYKIGITNSKTKKMAVAKNTVKKVERYREADKGHYVTEAYAKKHPKTTVKETQKTSTRKRSTTRKKTTAKKKPAVKKKPVKKRTPKKK